MTKAGILILGRSGQVGWELQRTLACAGEITALDQGDVDLSAPDSIRSVIQSARPAVIVNAAAYTAVDKAETDAELAKAINTTAPQVLAEEAKRAGSLLVHFSTDYVFDGTKATPYVETDAPNPINVYGRTKLDGDRAIETAGGEHLIFRTSWVFGKRGRNFLLTVLKLAKERPELRFVDDQRGAPTTSECIAQAVAAVLAQVRVGDGFRLDGRSGIYNLTNAGETTWCGFVREIVKQAEGAFGVGSPNVIPIASSEYPVPAARPANSRLNCDKLDETFGVRLPRWDHALGLVLNGLKESASVVGRLA
ncbi:MAG TPA: dTDP-4-dehydrorhamnose reductase [Terracidiphilus sp.]|nr:dTDP-4-dehydrorhamnose reductase [Terracidiphilus sp.]